MRKAALLISSAFLLLAPKAFAAYQWYVPITVTSTTSVASGTQVNFPMLVSSTLAQWEASSTGGKIQSLVTAPNGGQEAADLVFATSSANCNATPLNFETESYASSTGAVVDWVNVPSLSAGTVIYACYGNPSVTADQSHPSSTWNSSYAAVYHFASSPASTIYDSTKNANSLTTFGSPTSTASGEIDGGESFPNASQYGVAYASSSAVSGGGTGNTTLSALVNVQSFYGYDSANGGVIAAVGEKAYPGYDKAFYGGTSSTLSFGLFNGGSLASVKYASPVSTGVWYWLTGTLNGTLATFYVNGSAVGTTTVSGTWADEPICVDASSAGGCEGQAQRATSEITDETRVSSVALTPQWILTEYGNQSSPSTFYAVGSQAALAPAAPVPDCFFFGTP